MRRILGLVTFLIVLGGAQAEASNRSINQKIVEYRLIPVLKGEDLTAIELVIHFHADKDGQTLLELPDEWGGGVKYYEQLKDFKVKGGGNDSQTPITWHVLDLEGRPASFTFKPEGKTIVHSQKLILR